MHNKTIKRVAITGATGMIGMALISLLLEKNIEVLALVRKDSAKANSLPKDKKLNIIELDFLEEDSIDKEKINENLGCDVFFHLGWAATIGNGRNDIDLQMKNIEGTINAVKIAKSLGCHTFLGSGSQAEYGITTERLSAKTNTNPITGYGAAKLSAGIMSRIYAKSLDMKHIWCRILSIYGPYDNDQTMMMSAIKAFVNNEEIEFTKGEQIWDYLYVKDCARAIFLSAKKGINGKVYPIGSGKTRKLKEYIEKIHLISGTEVQSGIGLKPYPKGQVMYLQADIDELINDTGFVPEVEVESGIKQTIDWYKSNKQR
jgi:Nucleoside-diphosphate-sugar epimerases